MLVDASHIGRPVRLRNRLFVVRAGTRHRKALLMDRDVAAAINMIILGLLKLLRGQRPAAFESAVGGAGAGGGGGGAAAGGRRRGGRRRGGRGARGGQRAAAGAAGRGGRVAGAAAAGGSRQSRQS